MPTRRGRASLFCMPRVGVIGGVPEGSRRDHNIVRVSSFARKELSWHERSCIVLVVLVLYA